MRCLVAHKDAYGGPLGAVHELRGTATLSRSPRYHWRARAAFSAGFSVQKLLSDDITVFFMPCAVGGRMASASAASPGVRPKALAQGRGTSCGTSNPHGGNSRVIRRILLVDVVILLYSKNCLAWSRSPVISWPWRWRGAAESVMDSGPPGSTHTERGEPREVAKSAVVAALCKTLGTDIVKRGGGALFPAGVKFHLFYKDAMGDVMRGPTDLRKYSNDEVAT